METCRLHDIDPEAYLTWVFGKLAVPRRMADIDELLPWAYKRQLANSVPRSDQPAAA